MTKDIIELDPSDPISFPGETPLWRKRFVKYFLPLGVLTVTDAWRGFLAEVKPHLLETPRRTVADDDWYHAAKKYHWRERKNLFYQAELQDSIQAAKGSLESISLEAVEALRESLKDSRFRVRAAEAILDRVGLPALSQLHLSGGVQVNHGVDFGGMDDRTRGEWMKSMGRLALKASETEGERVRRIRGELFELQLSTSSLTKEEKRKIEGIRRELERVFPEGEVIDGEETGI